MAVPRSSCLGSCSSALADAQFLPVAAAAQGLGSTAEHFDPPADRLDPLLLKGDDEQVWDYSWQEMMMAEVAEDDTEALQLEKDVRCWTHLQPSSRCV